MTLPLADRIREARRLSEESHRATMQLAQLTAVHTSLDILERQAALRKDLEAPLPGEAIVDQLATTWPALVDLRKRDPSPDAPLTMRLRQRRAQLELARAFLQPLAADGKRHAETLHALQHDQRHELEKPEWSEAVAELQQIGRDREEAAEQLGPVRVRLAMVDPTRRLLDDFLKRLEEAEESAREAADQGTAAWRAATMAAGFVANLQDVAKELHLEVALPRAPQVGPAPDAERAEALLEEVAAARAALTELREALGTEGAIVAAEEAELSARHDELTKALLERMG